MDCAENAASLSSVCAAVSSHCHSTTILSTLSSMISPPISEYQQYAQIRFN